MTIKSVTVVKEEILKAENGIQRNENISIYLFNSNSGKMFPGRMVPGKMVPRKMVPGKMIPGKLKNKRTWGERRASWCMWNVGM